MKKLLILSCLLALVLGTAREAQAQVINIIAVDTAAVEGAADIATFEISRDDGAADLPIDLAIVAGATSAAPSDYVLNPPLGSVIIPGNGTSIRVTLTATDDTFAEADEDLTLEIIDNGIYIIGANSQATATIRANDFEVTNTDDYDPTGNPTAAEREGTLRQAIENAHSFGPDQTVTFSADPFFDDPPDTILLTGGELLITESMIIEGPGADLLMLSGDLDLSGDANFGDTRVFHFVNPDVGNPPPRCTLEQITIANSAPNITDSIGDGGAIFNDGADLSVLDVVIRDCTADNGGAIFNSGLLSLSRVSLEGNEAFQAGGAIYASQSANGSSVTTQRSILFRNTANAGGGIFSQGGNISILNSTLSENSATQGGGLFYQDGSVQITNSTIVENTADSDTAGGGIDFSFSVSTPLLDLDNTIVAANSAGLSIPTPSDIRGGVLPSPSLNNLISDAASAGGLSDGVNGNVVGIGGVGTILFADILEPLADNGGLTLTYLPIPGSSVIDNGDNSSSGFPPNSDQRDLPRIINGTVDIGSVEIQVAAPVLDPIGDLFADELTLLSFTASAIIPGGGASPVFSLDDGSSGLVPIGAFIDPNTGDFQWEPTEADGPGFFQFDVVVTRDDEPSSTTRETIGIEVSEINQSPVLDPVDDQIIEELMTLSFTASASDLDEPQNSLAFSLDPVSVGRGMSIGPATGQFIWTPGSAHAPGVYPVTISVSDDAATPLSASLSFTVEVTTIVPPLVSLSAVGSTIIHEALSPSVAPPDTPPIANFSLNRSDTGGDLSVGLRLENSSLAKHGTDFTMRLAGTAFPLNFSGDPLVATVIIPDGEPLVEIAIDAIDDAAAEADEIFSLSIVPQPDFVIGSGDLTQVIAQNDYGVTNLLDFDPTAAPDDGEGTLRQAFINAKAGLSLPQMPPVPADITFAPGVSGDLVLTQGALYLDTADFSITGPGSHILAVSGNLSSRVFIAYDPNGPRSYSISDLRVDEGRTAGNGGGIFNAENLTLENCVISGCLADNGGGITNEGELTMHHCLVTMNGAAIYGGGIDNFGGTAILHHSTISGNAANFGGGIECSFSGSLRVESTTIVGNTATLSGGGIDSYAATTALSNVTVSGNDAGYGAGIFNETSDLTIRQSTIAENAAASSGGGILTSSNAPIGNTLLHNTIVAGNTKGADLPADITTGNSSFVDLDPASSFNLVGSAGSAGGLTDGSMGNLVGLAGTGLLPLADIIAPLDDNGGPTATHALSAASLAIDAGDNASAIDTSGAALSSDQRGVGFSRIVAAAVDIGAFEVEPPALKILSCELSAGPEATITWESSAGAEYDVLCSSDLKNWLLVASGVPATGDRTSWTDVNPPASRAYFVVRPSNSE